MYRFVVTLKGPSTLFYQPEKKERKVINEQRANRAFLKEYVDPSKIISPQKGEGYFFLAGNFSKGAIHSEPQVHEPRVFLSIIPCNKKELEELKKLSYPIYPKEKTSYYE